MKREVVNSAGRIKECTEHIRSLFANEGFDVQKLRVDDRSVQAMVVQIRNMTIKPRAFLKTVTVFNPCVTLKLQVEGNNTLLMEVLDSKWFDKTVVMATGILGTLGTVAVTGAMGFTTLCAIAATGFVGLATLGVVAATEAMIFV